jgi:hypothetical protein
MMAHPIAPDIRPVLTLKGEEEFAQELRAWGAKPEYPFMWTKD